MRNGGVKYQLGGLSNAANFLVAYQLVLGAQGSPLLAIPVACICLLRALSLESYEDGFYVVGSFGYVIERFTMQIQIVIPMSGYGERFGERDMKSQSHLLRSTNCTCN